MQSRFVQQDLFFLSFFLLRRFKRMSYQPSRTKKKKKRKKILRKTTTLGNFAVYSSPKQFAPSYLRTYVRTQVSSLLQFCANNSVQIGARNYGRRKALRQTVQQTTNAIPSERDMWRERIFFTSAYFEWTTLFHSNKACNNELYSQVLLTISTVYIRNIFWWIRRKIKSWEKENG